MAGLAEEIRDAAVHPHAAADLVDQAQLLVGVGQLLGKAVELLLHPRELELIVKHRRQQCRLACKRLAGIGGHFPRLVDQPARIDRKPAANAKHIFAGFKILGSRGQADDPGDLPPLYAGTNGQQNSGK